MGKFISKSRVFMKRNTPTALTILGGIGVVATAVLSAQATPKAMIILEEARKEKGEDLTKLEKVTVATPVYVPAIMTGVTTIACIFGANLLNKRQQAALMSAYAFLDNSYKEYKKKVEELLDEEQVKEIRSEIAKDHYDGSMKPSNDNRLFYDLYSGRYFESTIEAVQRAEYRINRNLIMRDYAYLNEFYEELKIEPLDDCSEVGWSTGGNFEKYWQNWIDFTHEKTVIDDGSYEGMECHIIVMQQEPYIEFLEYS